LNPNALLGAAYGAVIERSGVTPALVKDVVGAPFLKSVSSPNNAVEPLL
jgi:hypothetical protein